MCPVGSSVMLKRAQKAPKVPMKSKNLINKSKKQIATTKQGRPTAAKSSRNLIKTSKRNYAPPTLPTPGRGEWRTLKMPDGSIWFQPNGGLPMVRVQERDQNLDPQDIALQQRMGTWEDLNHPIPSHTLENEPREAMEFDVLVVGGGPAGLSAAIKLKQLAAEANQELSVCLIEKGAEIGSHILSGNVFQPTYLDELIPTWREKANNPLKTKVKNDAFFFLTETSAIPSPMMPGTLDNHGNYIISLGKLCKFLAEEAEALGVEIYPGFAASEVLYNEKGAVAGIATPDSGINKKGEKTESFARGVELKAKQTLFGEGARGSCSEEIISKFKLHQPGQFQTYGIGIKEVWELDPKKHKEGNVYHTIGWPSPHDVYSGSFVYHAENNLAYLGLVIGLDYKNPWLSPYQEFQKWKTHPMITDMLEGGKPISYGARALTEGGYQSIPKLHFPGGALIGCSAGFMNVPKIKGSHNAMKTGMTAAEGIFERWRRNEFDIESLDSQDILEYGKKMETSPVLKELYAVRNIRPAFNYGMLPFFATAGLELFITGGKLPFTIPHHSTNDADQTEPAHKHTPIDYPKPDGKITFPLLENLTRSNVMHDDDQPAHLTYRHGKKSGQDKYSLEVFSGPESRFCPAGVYEYVPDPDGPKKESQKLQINAQNCIHCKTCDIKTPNEFIKWTIPIGQGGQGPNYVDM